MAATEGFRMVSIVRKTPARAPRKACASTAMSTASSLISAPATNAFSPAPVTISAANCRIVPRAPESVGKLAHGVPIQRVQLLRPVDREERDAVRISASKRMLP